MAEMRQQGLDPINDANLSTLMKAQFNATSETTPQAIDQAVALFYQLRRDHPSAVGTITLNILLHGLIMRGYEDQAMDHFCQMLVEKKIQPSLPTYNEMMTGLNRVGRYMDTLRLAENMKMRGIESTARTTGMINCMLIRALTIALLQKHVWWHWQSWDNSTL